MMAEPMHSETKTGGLLRWVGLTAAVGLGVFALVAWHSVGVERAAPDDAFRRFAEVRRHLDGEPVVRIGGDGTLTRRPVPIAHASPVSVLRVTFSRAKL